MTLAAVYATYCDAHLFQGLRRAVTPAIVTRGAVTQFSFCECGFPAVWSVRPYQGP